MNICERASRQMWNCSQIPTSHRSNGANYIFMSGVILPKTLDQSFHAASSRAAVEPARSIAHPNLILATCCMSVLMHVFLQKTEEFLKAVLTHDPQGNLLHAEGDHEL